MLQSWAFLLVLLEDVCLEHQMSVLRRGLAFVLRVRLLEGGEGWSGKSTWI